MAPRVLVSDELSETAVQIFRDRGVEVDYMPKLGKDKEKLAELIGQYDGLAIRSATKVTEKLLEGAHLNRLSAISEAGQGAFDGLGHDRRFSRRRAEVIETLEGLDPCMWYDA